MKLAAEGSEASPEKCSTEGSAKGSAEEGSVEGSESKAPTSIEARANVEARASVDARASVEAQASVEADLLELVRLMPPVVRGLKRQAAARRSAGLEPLREMLAAGSLGPRHLPVIVVLAFDGSITVSELARRIGLGVATTSLMVGELDRAGIVEREIDERDRRRTLVRIAAPLHDECVAFARERLAPMRRALERMGPATRAHFIAGWRVLAEEAGGVAGPDAGTAGPGVGTAGPGVGTAGPELCSTAGTAPEPAGDAGEV